MSESLPGIGASNDASVPMRAWLLENGDAAVVVGREYTMQYTLTPAAGPRTAVIALVGTLTAPAGQFRFLDPTTTPFALPVEGEPPVISTRIIPLRAGTHEIELTIYDHRTYDTLEVANIVIAVVGDSATNLQAGQTA